KGVSSTYNRDLLTETITDPNGKTTTLTFDPVGGVKRGVDGAGGIVLRTFDGKNMTSETRVIGAEDGPNAPPGDPHDLTTTYTYNSLGEVLTQTDPQGLVYRHTYDASGLPLSMSDPLGGASTQTYDPETGDLLSTTDPNGNTTAFNYDDHGN